MLTAAGRLELPPDAFAEAERAGAIAVEDDRVRFRHPLLRSLAYRGAPAEQRRRAHGALAGCLTAAPGTESERRAWHLAAAAVAPDEEVAGALAAAAERFAQRTGYLAAAYAYERAAELTPDPGRRGERLVEAAEATRLAGRPARARELLARRRGARRSTTRCAPTSRSRRRCSRRGWARSRSPPSATRAWPTRSPTPTAPPRRSPTPPAPRSRPATPSTALASARRAAELLDGISGHTACTVRETLGAVLVLRGEPAEGAPLLRAAAEWFEAEGEMPGRDYVAQALLWVEDYALARRLLDPLLAHARRVGDLRALTSALEVQAQLDYRTGDWRAAHAAAEESVRLSADTRADRPARLQPRRAGDRRGGARGHDERRARRAGRRDRRRATASA